MKKLFVDPRDHQGLKLLDAALTYIEFHPSEWDQKVYRCNTGMCLAGHIALTMAGGTLADPKVTASDSLLATDEDSHNYTYYDDKNRRVISIADRAKALLGEAYIPGMFDAHNTLPKLRGFRQQAISQVAENVKCA